MAGFLTAAGGDEKPAGEEVIGPFEYTAKGPRLDGKTIPWDRFRILEETPPDRPVPVADAEARAVFPAKRQATRTNGDLLALADWCAKNGLVDEEWEILSAVAVNSPRDRGLLKRMMARLEREERRARTGFRPPFEGRWKGMVDATRHHQEKVWAIYAIDFMKVDDEDRTAPKGKGREPSDYYGYGASVLAAAAGRVIEAKDRNPDVAVNRSGGFANANQVSIEHAGGEVTQYGHLKNGSILVKAGDEVERGQRIGLVGNSGASGVPHLHFAVLIPVRDASGAGTYVSIPHFFEDFVLSTVDGKDVGIRARRARPQEGWVIECPPASPPEVEQERKR